MVEIVDTHVHFWGLAIQSHPWINHALRPSPLRYGDYAAIRRDYMPEDLLGDAAPHRLVGVVHLAAGWKTEDPTGETRWLSEIEARTGLPHASVFRTPLDHADVEAVLDGNMAFPLTRGVRHTWAVPRAPDAWDRNAEGSTYTRAFRRGFAQLAARRMSFDLQTDYWNFPAAADLAKDFPDTDIILDHAGMLTDRAPETMSRWRKALEGLADHPRVNLKISGLGIAGERWSLARNAGLIADAVAILGAERCVFGSNFPVDRLIGDLADIFEGFARAIAHLPAADQRKILVDNARRLYRL